MCEHRLIPSGIKQSSLVPLLLSSGWSGTENVLVCTLWGRMKLCHPSASRPSVPLCLCHTSKLASTNTKGECLAMHYNCVGMMQGAAPGALDGYLDSILPVMEADLFGDIADAKDADAFAAKYRCKQTHQPMLQRTVTTCCSTYASCGAVLDTGGTCLCSACRFPEIECKASGSLLAGCMYILLVLCC